MRGRLDDLWYIGKDSALPVLIGGAIGAVLSYALTKFLDFVSDLDSWLYLLIPIAIVVLLYRVLYICVYRRTYSL